MCLGGAGLNGMDAEKEAEAHAFAEQELIPRRTFSAFASRGTFSKVAIQDFARSQGIAPGIIVGRLQHQGLRPYTHCNDLKVRYRWSQEKAHH